MQAKRFAAHGIEVGELYEVVVGDVGVGSGPTLRFYKLGA